MPHVNANIARAWRHRGEVGRIHYAIEKVDAGTRHLHVDEGHPLYAVLEEYLDRQGYEGPGEEPLDG